MDSKNNCIHPNSLSTFKLFYITFWFTYSTMNFLVTVEKNKITQGRMYILACSFIMAEKLQWGWQWQHFSRSRRLADHITSLVIEQRMNRKWSSTMKLKVCLLGPTSSHVASPLFSVSLWRPSLEFTEIHLPLLLKCIALPLKGSTSS